MDLVQSIGKYASHPLPHQVMASLLKNYRRPNDKIHAMIQEGILQSVTKGLYIAGPKVTNRKPEPFLVANHIHGPSYISQDSALAYYGLIPEKVYEITSMTTKTSRKYSTGIGLFSYTHARLPYFSLGIKSIELDTNITILMASPEKALFDKVITTAGAPLRSKSSVISFLEDDLRIDLQALRNFDVATMDSWLAYSPKKEALSRMINVIKQL